MTNKKEEPLFIQEARKLGATNKQIKQLKKTIKKANKLRESKLRYIKYIEKCKQKNLFCGVCGIPFKNQKMFSAHIREIHT